MKTNESFRQGLGFATRLGVEFVVATGIGTLMGYFLDKWLESEPWFLALGVIFGGAAGCLGVYRAANENSPPPEEDPGEEGAKEQAPQDDSKDLKF